jgi:prepilin-type N-terminal cleavage/methylation domain-containing protein
MKNERKYYKINNYKGFTFIELIVVITVIAILWTIWFFSYNWYISKSRDSVRISQASSIYWAMELYKTKVYLPIPEDKIVIYSSGTIIGYQWYANENILNMIWYQEWWIDPLDNKYFTYYLNTKLRKLGILTLLENSINEEDSKLERIPVTYWDKVWIILDTENKPIQENSQLKATWLDVSTTQKTYNVYFSDKDNISWTWDLLQVLYWTATTWIIWNSCWNYVEANAWYLLNPWYYLVRENSVLTKTYCHMTNLCIWELPLYAETNSLTASWVFWQYNTEWWECTFICQAWYVWNSTICESTTCLWTPPFGTIWNETSTTWWTRNYNEIGWLCTYICDTWYSRILNNCELNTYTVSWSFWPNASWATIDINGINVTANANWDFSTNINHWTDCSNIEATRPGYTCDPITTGPVSLTAPLTWLSSTCTQDINYCDFAWEDLFDTCDFWS